MSNGIECWQGDSRIDGSPVVCILTKNGANRKTGDMIQQWIIRADMDPMEAIRRGEDYAICGNCPHRGAAGNGAGRSCYVNVGQAPLQVFRTWQAGKYPHLKPSFYKDWFQELPLRFGAYGDPAAVPWFVTKYLASAARHPVGYTHQWLGGDQRLRQILMASVESEAQAWLAQSLGWRTYRTKLPERQQLPNEIVCPASKEEGYRKTCSICKGCHGAGSGQNVVIDIHGAANKRAAARINLL